MEYMNAQEQGKQSLPIVMGSLMGKKQCVGFYMPNTNAKSIIDRLNKMIEEYRNELDL